MDYLIVLQNNDKEALEKYLNNHDANEEIQGQSLLYWAVYLGNVEFTKILIERGADVNGKDKLGRTPLEITSYFGFLEIAELLLKHDAKITTACIERASNGWDGNVQTSILKLFEEHE